MKKNFTNITLIVFSNLPWIFHGSNIINAIISKDPVLFFLAYIGACLNYAYDKPVSILFFEKGLLARIMIMSLNPFVLRKAHLQRKEILKILDDEKLRLNTDSLNYTPLFFLKDLLNQVQLDQPGLINVNYFFA